MAITVRPYDGESEGYWDVRSLTYYNGQPIPPVKRTLSTRGFMAEEDGTVQGTYNVLDLTCSCRGAVLDCGGIAGVAVHPARRGSGIGSAMMRYAVREMRERGVPMASLYAYREWYYRRFGYEMCGTRSKLNCPAHRFPHLAPELPVRCLPSTEWAQIDGCHQKFVMARNGGSLRDQKLWERIVSDKNVIYAAGDPTEAYAIVQHEVDFWKIQSIQEVTWSTARGYRSILGLLANIGVNKTAVEWTEPGDSPFLASYLDQSVDVALNRSIMYRVTDVPAALAGVQSFGLGSFTFQVIDDVVPENCGPWLVTFNLEGVTIVPAVTADFTITIQAFTQALLGEPSLGDLVRNGMIDVHREEGLASAEFLLPPSRVYCLEFF